MVAAGTGVRVGLGCAAAAWASVVACGDENGLGEVASYTQLDRALCEKLVQCGCGEAFADLGAAPPLSCDGWTIFGAYYDGEEGYYYGYGYEGGYDPPEELPRSVDEQCVQQITQRIEALDCNLEFALGPADCREFCSPVIGPRFLGEPCRAQAECGRGLKCHREECTDPCLARPPAEGDPCDSGGECGQELVCATASDEGGPGVCMALPVAGQPCYFGACARDLRCDASDPDAVVCVPLGAEGDACMGHLECATRYCPAGHCALAPGVNEPCGANDACAPGTTCVRDDAGEGTCRVVGSQCGDFLEDVLVAVAGEG